MSAAKKHIVSEPTANYEKAETDLLRVALQRSYEERFHVMTSLMKMNIIFSKAKIQHQTFS